MLFNFVFNSYFLKHSQFVSKAQTIVIGDSRMMTGIDPSLINNCINTAQNSESYFISYYKLKYILKHSKNVKKVILGFSYPSFSGYMDKIYKNDLATSDVLNRIYPIISIEDFGPLEVDKEKYYTILFRNMLVIPHINHEKFIGEYSPLPSGMQNANVNSTIKRHYFDKDSINSGISYINRSYLDSIINLTKSQNIDLYLVNLPLQKDYIQRIPENFISFYDQTKKELIDQNITILDFGNELIDDENFKDHVHLSSNGASLISKRINQVLK
jgi:hypothetical protein